MSLEEKNRYCVYWTSEQSVPIIVDRFLGETLPSWTYMATDIRPVFLQERYLLTLLCPKYFSDCLSSSVWADSSNNFFIDGIKIRVSINKLLREADKKEVSQKLFAFEPSDLQIAFERKNLQAFCNANKGHFNHIVFSEEPDNEGWPIGADPFVKACIEKYPKRTPFVSFSGGKDSTVVSSIVLKSLANPSIIHIFGDTTLELPETYEYVQKFRTSHDKTPFLIEKNESSDFMQLCKRIGPPSRVKRWCCSIFKTGPMGTTLADMDLKLLTFYGVRRFESVSRSKYSRVSPSPKLKKQFVASPIIDWLDIDVWLYILTTGIDFNYAYRRGYTRVGCWCCPNNSEWSDGLMAVCHPDKYNTWHSFLVDFAKRIGKEDAEVYVSDGKWKARQGGSGLDARVTQLNSKDCTVENNAKLFSLTRPLDESFYEFFKPFGNLAFSIGKKSLSEVFVIGKRDQLLLKISGQIGGNQARIAVLGDLNEEFHSKSMASNIFKYIDRQIRKYQTCICCQACNSICPVSAITVTGEKYEINEKKCIHCLHCVMHFDDGCLIASALSVRKGIAT